MYENFYPGNGNNSNKVAINIQLGTLLSFLYAHLLSCKLCFCPDFGTAGMQKIIGTERPASPAIMKRILTITIIVSYGSLRSVFVQSGNRNSRSADLAHEM